MDKLNQGNISTVAFVDLIHLNYFNDDDVCCSRKTRQILKGCVDLCHTWHTCIVEEIIEVDEFDEVDICCSMKVRQIRKRSAGLCYTQYMTSSYQKRLGLSHPPYTDAYFKMC